MFHFPCIFLRHAPSRSILFHMETLGGPIALTALSRLHTQLMVHAQLLVHVTKAFACKVGTSHLHEVIYSFPSCPAISSPLQVVCFFTFHQLLIIETHSQQPYTPPSLSHQLPTMLVWQPHHLEHSCTYCSLMTTSTTIYTPDMVRAPAPVDFLHAWTMHRQPPTLVHLHNQLLSRASPSTSHLQTRHQSPWKLKVVSNVACL